MSSETGKPSAEPNEASRLTARGSSPESRFRFSLEAEAPFLRELVPWPHNVLVIEATLAMPANPVRIRGDPETIVSFSKHLWARISTTDVRLPSARMH